MSHEIIWWLRHLTGTDNQQSFFYMFYSGIGPCLVGAGALLLGWWSIRIALRALELENRLLTAELEQAKAQLEEQ